MHKDVKNQINESGGHSDNQSKADLNGLLKKYEGVMETTTDAIVILDRDYCICDLNSEYANSFDKRKEDMLGKPLWDFYDQPDIDKCKEIIDRVSQMGAPISGRGKLGSICVEYKVRPIFSDNQIVNMIMSSRNITKQKDVEEQLQEKVQKFKDLFENAEVGIFRASVDGSTLIEFNKKLTQMFEFSINEHLSRSPFMDWLRNNEKQVTKWIFKEKQESLVYEFDYKSKNNEAKTVLTTIKPIPKYGYTEGIVIDITDRKKQERQLQETKSKLYSFINSSTEVFAFLDNKLNIIDINNAGEQFLMIKNLDDIFGKNIFDVLPRLSDYSIKEDYLYVLGSGRPLYIDDITIQTMTGDRNIALNAFKIKDGLGLIMSDISRHAHVEQELKEINFKQNDLFLERQKLLGQITLNIVNHLEPILKYVADMKDNEEHAKIKRDAFLVQHLIDSISQITKVDTYSIDVKLKKLDLIAVINDAISTTEVTKNEHWKIDLDLPKSAPIMGDEYLLNRVFSNIVADSFKYIDRPLTLSIRGELREKSIKIFFEYLRPNIDDQLSGDITAPTFHYDIKMHNKATADSHLAIIKKILEDHRGSFFVKTKEASESILVILAFPLSDSFEAAKADSAEQKLAG